MFLKTTVRGDCFCRGCIQYWEFRQGQDFNWKVRKCSQKCKVWDFLCQLLMCMITNAGEHQSYLLCICSRFPFTITVLTAGHFQPRKWCNYDLTKFKEKLHTCQTWSLTSSHSVKLLASVSGEVLSLLVLRGWGWISFVGSCTLGC